MENMHDVGVLRERLDRLERSHARLKRLLASGLVIAAGLGSAAAAKAPTPTVDAREFRVVDADGKVRATLGPSEFRWGGVDDGPFATATTALRLYDEYEVPHVILSSTWSELGDHRGGSLLVSGKRDGAVGQIGASGFGASVLLHNEGGNFVALGGQTPHGITVRNGLTESNSTFVGGGVGFEAADGKMTFYGRDGRATSSIP